MKKKRSSKPINLSVSPSSSSSPSPSPFSDLYPHLFPPPIPFSSPTSSSLSSTPVDTSLAKPAPKFVPKIHTSSWPFCSPSLICQGSDVYVPGEDPHLTSVRIRSSSDCLPCGDSENGRSHCLPSSSCFPCTREREHCRNAELKAVDEEFCSSSPNLRTSKSSPADDQLKLSVCVRTSTFEEEELISFEEARDGGVAEEVLHRPSFWSSFVSSTFSVLENRADYIGRSLAGVRKGKYGRKWNAVVRKTVGSGPIRRLQERLLGSRWTASATSGVIWLLGERYEIGDGNSTDDLADSQSFLEDFRSRIWFTYRKGFEAVGASNLTSDVGWGCMLRSGQMLLAQSNCREYLEILECFGDSSSRTHPFSIHNILDAGSRYGLVAGSWLGPYALCRSLEALARADKECSEAALHERALPMAVYVVSGDADGEQGGAPCICIDEVERLCSNWENSPGSGGWAPLLLLVPLVLGLNKVNPRYVPSLWASFSFPQSLGIAGGKTRASTYLVGVQDDQALYLDPHEVQQVLVISPDDLEVDTSSYHCSVVRNMPLSSIDPSLALGFYCKNQDEFYDLCDRTSELARDSNGAPMFTVVQTGSKLGWGEGFLTIHDEEMYVQDSTTLDRGNIGGKPSSEDGWQIL